MQGIIGECTKTIQRVELCGIIIQGIHDNGKTTDPRRSLLGVGQGIEKKALPYFFPLCLKINRQTT